MANTLAVEILAPIGLDLTAQIDGLLTAEFVSDNGTTARFKIDATGSEITLDYVLQNGEIFVTDFDFITDGQTVVSASYEDPEATGQTSWVIELHTFIHCAAVFKVRPMKQDTERRGCHGPN